MMNQKKCTTGRQYLAWIPCSGSWDGFSTNVKFGDLRKSLRNAVHSFFLPVILLFSMALCANPAAAADVKLVPRLAVGGAYDDNILMTADDKVSSSIVTVSPGLEMDYQTLLSNLRIKADLDILSYLDESDLDRTNQYYRLSGDHRIKDRWTAYANFNYFRDTTLNTYLQETGRVIDRVQRDYLEAGGGMTYDISTISSISSEYTFQTASYEGDVYSDYDNHNVNLNFSHRLKNERDTLSIGPAYYRRTNDDNDVDSLSLDFGWARNWTDITRSAASIGVRYTNVKKNDDGSEDNNLGGKASLNITSKGLASTTNFRYFHDLRTTEVGDDVNVDNFFLEYRRSLTQRFGAGINGRLVFSYKLFNQQSDLNDERYFWVEPNMFYLLTEQLELSLKYRYQNNTEIRDDGDINRERNIVWLELSYRLPILM